LAVFCDSQSQDGGFDVTALRVAIVPIPSAVFLLGFGIAGLAGLKLNYSVATGVSTNDAVAVG
jgi:hypothetical protein